MSPAWARVVATLALVAGIVGGLGLGWATVEPDEGDALAWSVSSLADEYLDGALAEIGPEEEAQ
jgi:hypothetical protein